MSTLSGPQFVYGKLAVEQIGMDQQVIARTAGMPEDQISLALRYLRPGGLIQGSISRAITPVGDRVVMTCAIGRVDETGRRYVQSQLVVLERAALQQINGLHARLLVGDRLPRPAKYEQETTLEPYTVTIPAEEYTDTAQQITLLKDIIQHVMPEPDFFFKLVQTLMAGTTPLAIQDGPPADRIADVCTALLLALPVPARDHIALLTFSTKGWRLPPIAPGTLSIRFVTGSDDGYRDSNLALWQNGVIRWHKDVREDDLDQDYVDKLRKAYQQGGVERMLTTIADISERPVETAAEDTVATIIKRLRERSINMQDLMKSSGTTEQPASSIRDDHTPIPGELDRWQVSTTAEDSAFGRQPDVSPVSAPEPDAIADHGTTRTIIPPVPDDAEADAETQPDAQPEAASPVADSGTPEPDAVADDSTTRTTVPPVPDDAEADAETQPDAQPEASPGTGIIPSIGTFPRPSGTGSRAPYAMQHRRATGEHARVEDDDKQPPTTKPPHEETGVADKPAIEQHPKSTTPPADQATGEDVAAPASPSPQIPGFVDVPQKSKEEMVDRTLAADKQKRLVNRILTALGTKEYQQAFELMHQARKPHISLSVNEIVRIWEQFKRNAASGRELKGLPEELIELVIHEATKRPRAMVKPFNAMYSLLDNLTDMIRFANSDRSVGSKTKLQELVTDELARVLFDFPAYEPHLSPQDTVKMHVRHIHLWITCLKALGLDRDAAINAQLERHRERLRQMKRPADISTEEIERILVEAKVEDSARENVRQLYRPPDA